MTKSGSLGDRNAHAAKLPLSSRFTTSRALLTCVLACWLSQSNSKTAKTVPRAPCNMVLQLNGAGRCRKRSPSPPSAVKPELWEPGAKHSVTKQLNKLNNLVQFCNNETTLDPDQVKKMVEQKPNLLSLSIERNIVPVVKWLRHEVNMTRKGVSRTIKKHPGILASSVDRKLQPTLQWLLSVQVPLERIGHLVERAPSLLCYSIENNLQHKLHFLQQHLPINSFSLGRLIADCPHLLISDVEHGVLRHFQWFESFLDIERARFLDVIVKHPKILEYSIHDKIAPVVSFVLESLQCSKAELAQQVIRFPQLFSYSLHRIKDRVERVRAQLDWLHGGRAVAVGSQGLRKGRPRLALEEGVGGAAYHLPYLLKLTESDFERKFREPEPAATRTPKHSTYEFAKGFPESGSDHNEPQLVTLALDLPGPASIVSGVGGCGGLCA